jgi:hypothetical protein
MQKPFSFYEFFLDDYYKQLMLYLNNDAKICINILDIINESPHFKSMLESFVIPQYELERISLKSQFMEFVKTPEFYSAQKQE